MHGVMLADGIGQTLPQQGVQTLLLLGCLGLAWAAVRAQDVRIFGRPWYASRALAFLATAALVLAFVAPSMLGIKIASVRPSTAASITILSPRPQQVLKGNPATVRVRLRLAGARVVSYTSADLVPDRGHIHLYLDGLFSRRRTGPRPRSTPTRPVTASRSNLWLSTTGLTAHRSRPRWASPWSREPACTRPTIRSAGAKNEADQALARGGAGGSVVRRVQRGPPAGNWAARIFPAAGQPSEAHHPLAVQR